MRKILTIQNKSEEQFLRTKIEPFDFGAHSKDEIREIVKEMRTALAHSDDGVGLAGNQIGFSHRLFIAYYDHKFYAIFNPEITKFSKETEKEYEGCLSVPGIDRKVERAKQITIEGQKQNGKKIKMNVQGVLARIFQHETDHLNGILFIDRAK
jgi:peptide deformylase